MATQVDLIAPGGSPILSLTNGSFGYRLGDMGLGLPPLHRIEERGPLQNGTTDLGYRLDPRIVHLALFAVGGHNYDYWNARQTLLAFLRPKNAPLILRYTVDIGASATAVYLLDCYYAGGMELDSKDRRGFGQNLAITLRAVSPNWYTNSPGYTQVLSGGVQSALPNPLYFFELTQATGKALNYYGSADENPIIQLYGPLIAPIRVGSYTTNEYLQYNNNIPGAGANVINIDTRYGHKTVIDNVGSNKISALDPSSNLATFHLASSSYTGVPTVYTINEFQVAAGSAGGSGAAIQIIYNYNYIGF